MSLFSKFPQWRDLVNFLPRKAVSKWGEFPTAVPGRPSVILVSGFGASRRNLHIIRRRFLRDGFNVVVLSLDWQELSDGIHGLHRMAEKLSDTVNDLKKEMGSDYCRISIVAHSAGGLIARYYIQQLGGYNFCACLVTLATPHRGTWLPVLGFFSPLIVKARILFQLLPISPFIRTLNRVPLPEYFPLLSIASSEDRFCPAEKTKVPHCLKQSPMVKSYVIENLSHSDFLLSKYLYEQIRTFMDTLEEFKKAS